MKLKVIQQALATLLANLPNDAGDTTVEIKDYSKGKGQLEIIVNGWLERTYSFNVTLADIKRFYSWLEQILLKKVEETTEFAFADKEIRTGHHYVLGFKPTMAEGVFSEYGDNGEQYDIPLRNFGMVYIYDVDDDKVAETSLMGREDFPRRLYTLIRYTDSLRVKSEVIEKYFLSKDIIHLDYKEYHGNAKIAKGDLRYYGKVYFTKNGKEKYAGCGYAASNPGELLCRFKYEVDEIISRKEEAKANKAWHKEVDVTNLVPFFCLDSKKIEEKIQSVSFDKNVLEKVPGIEIDIPVTYVTKCWEYLLNDHIPEHLLYRIQLEEDYDPEEYNYERTPDEVREEIRKTKELLRQYFDIDIDEISFDLCDVLHSVKYNDDDFYEISEWLLDCIPYHYDDMPRDGIISLMKFTYGAMLDLQENSADLSTIIK
jgi:hypothetical protein